MYSRCCLAAMMNEFNSFHDINILNCRTTDLVILIEHLQAYQRQGKVIYPKDLQENPQHTIVDERAPTYQLHQRNSFPTNGSWRIALCKYVLYIPFEEY